MTTTRVLQRSAKSTNADDLTAKQTAFTEAIVKGDHDGANVIVGELLSAQQTLGDIYTRVISPALVTVGDLWCRNDIGVGEEHLASEIVLGQMDRLRALFTRRDPRSSYRIMIGCVEGELHYIGARMTADLCLAEGWNVDFVGANIPNKALIEVVDNRRPQILGLSITMDHGLAMADATIKTLERIAPSLPIVIGGQGVQGNGANPSWESRCQIAHDVVQGVAIIGRLLRSVQPGAVLKEYQLVLARRVRELRTHKGWTQERLADASSVTRVCIVAVEGGKQNVSMDILVRLANALGVAPESLLSAQG